MKPAKQAKHTVTTRIPLSHYRRLERIAKAQNSSLAAIVNEAIEIGIGLIEDDLKEQASCRVEKDSPMKSTLVGRIMEKSPFHHIR